MFRRWLHLLINSVRKNSKKFWSGILGNYGRTQYQSYQKVFLHFALIFIFLFQCQTYNQSQEITNYYDFYFFPSFIQIIGEGKVESKHHISYEEKKRLCIQNAKIYADSKWLGITEKYEVSQKRWLEQLKMNYYFIWKKCLDEARIAEYIPIYPDRCKIKVHYYCNPFDW